MKLYDEAIRHVQASAQEAQAMLHKAQPAIRQFEDLCRVLIQQGLEFIPNVRATEDGLNYSINIPSRHFKHAGPLLAELEAMHAARLRKWSSGGLEAYSICMAEVPDFTVVIMHPADDEEVPHVPV